MIQIFKIVLLALLLTGLHAKTAKWHKLQSLTEYSGSDYTLKEGVEYLEIRKYFQATRYDRENYEVTVSIYKSALQSFSPKIVKQFKTSSPNLSEQTNIRRGGICIMSGCMSHISAMDL